MINSDLKFLESELKEVVNLFGGIAVEQSVCAIKLAIEQLMLGGGNFENFIFRNDL